MGNAQNIGQQVAAALSLYDQLPAQGADAGALTVSATRLELAASDLARAGGHHAQVAKLRDRADDCRARARRAAQQALLAAPSFVADDGSVALRRAS